MVCIPTLSPGPKLPWKKSLYHQLQFLDTWPPTTWHMSEKSLQPTRVGAFFQLQIFTTPDLARRASPLSPWVPPACQPAACLEGRPESRTLCEKSSGTTNGFGALRPCGQKADGGCLMSMISVYCRKVGSVSTCFNHLYTGFTSVTWPHSDIILDVWRFKPLRLTFHSLLSQKNPPGSNWCRCCAFSPLEIHHQL